MRKDCKDSLIAEAHKNPEYAKMTARQLASVIDASQPVISKWRRKMRAMTDTYSTRNRVLQQKVTVDSVRRKWEEKYMALSRQYDYLSDRLVEMAKNADKHRNEQIRLGSELNAAHHQYKEAIASIEHYRHLLAQEKRSWISRFFSGVFSNG